MFAYGKSVNQSKDFCSWLLGNKLAEQYTINQADSSGAGHQSDFFCLIPPSQYFISQIKFNLLLKWTGKNFWHAILTGALESTDIYMRVLILLKHVEVFRSLLEKEARTFSSNNATYIFQQPKARKRLPLLTQQNTYMRFSNILW